MLTDTHCHLDFHQFNNERFEILDRAHRGNIHRVLNPGIDITSSKKAVMLANRYDAVFAAIGVHPNNSSTWTDETADQLREIAQDEKVVAIGEIGLDYYHDAAPHEIQIHVFEEQLLLASFLKLPVIIHTRNKNKEDRSAIEDALDLISKWVENIPLEIENLKANPGVLHSFSSAVNYAEQAVMYNFAVGITGPVTYKNNEPMRSVANNINLQHILVETDAPFLTPHPYRGKRNEPAFVNYIIEKIAEIRQISYDQVATVTTKNAKRIFNW